MSTKQQYVEYLVSPPKNCTCPSRAEQLEDVSPDVVNDFLRQKRFMPREVGKLGQDRSDDSPDAFLIVDDSVHDKRDSRVSELGRAQYRGNDQRGVRGSGVVRLGHRGGKAEDFYPLDSRGSAPGGEGKTTNEHCHARFVNAVAQQQLQAGRSSVRVGTRRPSICS